MSVVLVYERIVAKNYLKLRINGLKSLGACIYGTGKVSVFLLQSERAIWSTRLVVLEF